MKLATQHILEVFDLGTINKKEILTELRVEFNRWEELLGSMSEEQIITPQLPSNWSIKDEIVHLWAWQQRSVARTEAALYNKKPDYPRWHEPGNEAVAQGSTSEPDPEEELDETNTWIYEAYRDRSWLDVYADWRAQFLRFLELSEQIPERDLVEQGRYAWMGEDPLIASLEGSYEHHKEHLDELLARLGRRE
jgi:hypothetical protein